MEKIQTKKYNTSKLNVLSKRKHNINFTKVPREQKSLGFIQTNYFTNAK